MAVKIDRLAPIFISVVFLVASCSTTNTSALQTREPSPTAQELAGPTITRKPRQLQPLNSFSPGDESKETKGFQRGISLATVLQHFSNTDTTIVSQSENHIVIRFDRPNLSPQSLLYGFDDNGLIIGPERSQIILREVEIGHRPATDLTWVDRFLINNNYDSNVFNNYAWMLATSFNVDVRDAEKALVIAQIGNEIGPVRAAHLDTLAAAFAANGQFEDAIETQQRVLELAPDNDKMRQRLAKYQNGKPYFAPDDYIELRPLSSDIYNRAIRGDANALFEVAAYCLTYDVLVNYKEGAAWLAKSALRGNSIAMNELGYSYRTGEYGTGIDMKLSQYWLIEADKQGEDFAPVNLSLLYSDAAGELHDEAKSVQALEKAAERGVTHAKLELASRYQNGHGVTANQKTADKLYLELQNEGYTAVQYFTDNGNIMNKLGHERFIEHVQWKELKLDEIHKFIHSIAHDLVRQITDERSSIRYIMINGSLTLPTETAPYVAFMLLEHAAYLGNFEAQSALSAAYTHGFGVTPSKQAADYWNRQTGNEEP